MTPEMTHPVPEVHGSRLVRMLFTVTGMISLAIGIAGIFLPLLPTTVFIIAAAACFARGSERFHAHLMANSVFGPVIREWREHRSMPARAKRIALATVVISIGTSMFLVPADWHRLLLLGVGVTLALFLWRIPVRG